MSAHCFGGHISGFLATRRALSARASSAICAGRHLSSALLNLDGRFNGNKKSGAKTRGAKETRERRMAKAPPSAKRDRIKAFAPALVDYTNDVIYGDLWERKALSKRDRSLITVAALVATYRPEQLASHLSRAIANGVTQEEITEVITHMAFYAGWPAAMSAAQVAYTVLVEDSKGE
jgi:4-carboxymuconolactone decarboxylase